MNTSLNPSGSAAGQVQQDLLVLRHAQIMTIARIDVVVGSIGALLSGVLAVFYGIAWIYMRSDMQDMMQSGNFIVQICGALSFLFVLAFFLLVIYLLIVFLQFILLIITGVALSKSKPWSRALRIGLAILHIVMAVLLAFSSVSKIANDSVSAVPTSLPSTSAPSRLPGERQNEIGSNPAALLLPSVFIILLAAYSVWVLKVLFSNEARFYFNSQYRTDPALERALSRIKKEE